MDIYTALAWILALSAPVLTFVYILIARISRTSICADVVRVVRELVPLQLAQFHKNPGVFFSWVLGQASFKVAWWFFFMGFWNFEISKLSGTLVTIERIGAIPVNAITGGLYTNPVMERLYELRVRSRKLSFIQALFENLHISFVGNLYVLWGYYTIFIALGAVTPKQYVGMWAGGLLALLIIGLLVPLYVWGNKKVRLLFVWLYLKLFQSGKKL